MVEEISKILLRLQQISSALIFWSRIKIMQFLEDFHLILDALTIGVIDFKSLITSRLMFDFENNARSSLVKETEFDKIMSEKLLLHWSVEDNH